MPSPTLNGATSIGELITTGATHVNTVLDRDDAGSAKTIQSQTTVAHPATTLFSLISSGLTVLPASGLPYSGLVKIGATGDVVATASAGSGAANPSITGGSFEVCLFDTASPPLLPQGTCPVGYERLVVVPGTAGTLSTSASLLVNGQGVYPMPANPAPASRTTARWVFRTEPMIVVVSIGRRVRGSTISTEMPSLASSSATSSARYIMPM